MAQPSPSEVDYRHDQPNDAPSTAGFAALCARIVALAVFAAALPVQASDTYRKPSVGTDGVTAQKALEALSGIAAIDAGSDHACALTTGGGVRCWGSNAKGQLGDGSTTDRSTPTDVATLGSGVAAISAGGSHTCAVTVAGGVKCWGYNAYGQLGDNSTSDRLTPVDVVGLSSGVTAVATGENHTCALTTVGGVKCWGFNNNSQLGDGSITDRRTPVDVLGLSSGIAAISAGDRHNCVLTTSGGLKCWGANDVGELGDGSSTSRASPVNVAGLASGIATVSAGFRHTCAVTASGSVKCWGYNFHGQVGDGSTITRRVPVDATGLASGFVAVSSGREHTCARSASGAVRCWGSNVVGTLGDGTETNRLTGVGVIGFSTGVAAISAGAYHNCAVTVAGQVQCWGTNYRGQLGNNTSTLRLTPVDVSGLTAGVVAISTGRDHSCALITGGRLKCWGDNTVGQLGDGSLTTRWLPGDVIGLTLGVAQVSVGDDHACVLTVNGGVKCWGENDQGQLGDGTKANRPVPVDVIGLASGVASIAAGRAHTCALMTNGGVKCWGYNYNYNLGTRFTGNLLAPEDVIGLPGPVTAISAGIEHTCALIAGGRVMCWGWNYNGQLGDGSGMSGQGPVYVIGLVSGVTAVVAGGNSTCALTVGGRARCWGAGYASSTPVDVVGLASGVADLSLDALHACALMTTGEVKCWGINEQGQLGDGSLTRRLEPVNVSGLATRVTAVSAGGAHTCALTESSGMKCWGSGFSGQLGDGSAGYRPFPVTVLVDQAEQQIRAMVDRYYRAILGREPDATGRDFWASEAARVVSLGADIKEVFYAMSIAFFASTEYAGRFTSSEQYVRDLYKTFFDRDPAPSELSYWAGEFASLQSPGALLNIFLFSTEFSDTMASLFGSAPVRPEVNLTMDFFRGVLGRLPDNAGFTSWRNQLRAAQCQGAAAVSSKVVEIANAFFKSAEAASRSRSDRGFMSDVYNTYLRRGPAADTAGFNFWVRQVPTLGRDGVRAQFVPSAEFQARVSQIVAAGCLP